MHKKLFGGFSLKRVMYTHHLRVMQFFHFRLFSSGHPIPFHFPLLSFLSISFLSSYYFSLTNKSCILLPLLLPLPLQWPALPRKITSRWVPPTSRATSQLQARFWLRPSIRSSDRTSLNINHRLCRLLTTSLRLTIPPLLALPSQPTPPAKSTHPTILNTPKPDFRDPTASMKSLTAPCSDREALPLAFSPVSLLKTVRFTFLKCFPKVDSRYIRKWNFGISWSRRLFTQLIIIFT